jgi:excinuclease ABC subunit C
VAKSDHSHLSPTLRTLPDSPGVYQFLNAEGEILYVGKAKSLKKRVSSYFVGDRAHSGKVKVLVRRIAVIEHIVVDTELDALLLENSLIKQYQPRYNIQLKDDKTYPWICVKKEPFPRVFSTRNMVNDGSEYFGPYASGRVMHNLLELIRQLYPLRTCAYRLTDEAISSGKYKVCLQYHIKNCLGPCEGLQTAKEYRRSIDEIRSILKGNVVAVIRSLRQQMDTYAAALEFERAQRVKVRIGLLEQYRSKSIVVNPKYKDVDVFSYHADGDAATVNYLKVIEGAIVQSHHVALRRGLDEAREEVLLYTITDIRQKFHSEAPEVLVPFPVRLPGSFPNLTVPQRGDKLRLLELSQQNLKLHVLEQKKRQELADPERHTRRIMQQMKSDLRLSQEPVYIECFDNSNLQGTNPVAAMVVFRNGRPAKSEYRHFNIKTVEGPDDFASMQEVITRRYSRLLAEEKELPQLIVVDGGKGQLSSAVESLERLGLRGTIAVIGIAKRLEEIYYPDDPLPLHIDKRSESLKVIQHARNEAHRFGITHHRGRREKGVRETALTQVSGIGKGTAEKLLTTFKSLTALLEAGEKSVAAVVGPAKARLLFEHFNKDGTD